MHIVNWSNMNNSLNLTDVVIITLKAWVCCTAEKAATVAAARWQDDEVWKVYKLNMHVLPHVITYT